MPTTPPRSVKKYTSEDVQKAINLVRHEGMSIAAAAKSYGIPKTTLQDKISGKYKVDAKIGRPSVLTQEEEEIIVKWTIDLAKAGFPVTKDQLIWTVHKLIRDLKRPNPFTNSTPGDKWYALFLNRHPQIAERVSQALTTARGNVTEERLRQWFAEVRSYLEEKGLMQVLKNPKSVFNADETAFFLCPKGKRVLAKKGEKQIHSLSGNDDKECLTVLVNANADGDVAPTMVVYDYQRIPDSIMRSSPEGWGIGKSESGWMNCETFFEYVTNVFYPWLVKNNIPFPVVLFVDGHTSHISLPLSEFCTSKKIELVALFPNATHILQPLDVAVFRPLKCEWKKHVQRWKFENSGRKMRKDEFAPLLSKVINESLKRETIQNGFKTTGLSEMDPEKLNYNKLLIKTPGNGGSMFTLEAQAKEEQNFLNTLEVKIGVTTVRRFAASEVETREESLYKIWKDSTDELANLRKKIEDLKKKEIEKKEKDKPREDDSVNDRRGENDLEEDVDGNLVQEDGQYEHVVHELEDLLGIESDNQREIIPHTSEPGMESAIQEIVIDSDDINFEAISNEMFCDENNIFEISVDVHANTLQIHPETIDQNPVICVENFENLPGPSTSHITPEKCNTTNISPNHDKTPVPLDSNLNISKTLENNIPSPFKRSLFWPEENTSSKKRKPKEKIPAVVTSEQYKAYLKKKEENKRIKEMEKEIKRLQREAKKIIKKEDTNKKVTTKRKKEDMTSGSEDEDSERSASPVPVSESDLNNLAVNTWVVVPYIVHEKKEYFVGQIKSLQDGKVAIKFLTKRGNKFAWPEEPDIDNDVPVSEIVQVLSPPNMERRGFFTFFEKIMS